MRPFEEQIILKDKYTSTFSRKIYCVDHPSNILQHAWKIIYEQLGCLLLGMYFFYCSLVRVIMEKQMLLFICNNHKKALSHLELNFVVDVSFEKGIWLG